MLCLVTRCCRDFRLCTHLSGVCRQHLGVNVIMVWQHGAAGLESFPAEWQDGNLSENDSFLSFVDYAVKQALEPYRSAGGHNGLLVSCCSCCSHCCSIFCVV